MNEKFSTEASPQRPLWNRLSAASTIELNSIEYIEAYGIGYGLCTHPNSVNKQRNILKLQFCLRQEKRRKFEIFRLGFNIDRPQQQ